MKDYEIISIGESQPKEFKVFAAGIKFVEGTDHTHSFTSWRDNLLDVRKVAEARGGGCRFLTNIQFKHENEVVRIYQYKITPERLKKAEKYIWEQLAKPYGNMHILGLLLMRAKLTEGNIFKDGEYSQICVELSVRMICIALDIDVPKNVENWGLREMHEFNEGNYEKGLCEKASQEKIDSINGKS